MKWMVVLLWPAVTLLFVLGACSVLVDPSVLSIKCELAPGGAGEDPCLAAGMHCVGSECRPCEEPGAEICNGVDDDCDGMVDEGHDNDNDGFTWCGGGHPELADCEPNDRAIHPAAQFGPDHDSIPAPDEACDGKDNDCDMKVDEDLSCSDMAGCTSDDDCSGQQRCDASTGVCFVPRSVGSGCTEDSHCAGGFCLKKGQYDLNVELSGDRCASACCTDEDCGAGSVCVTGDSGVRVCLPANIAARGFERDGSGCSSDGECASGSCVGGRCSSVCISDDGCGGAQCVLSSGGIRESRAWSCVDDEALLGREDAGALCSALDPTGCRSGFCYEGVCANACGRTADCGVGAVCAVDTIRALFGPVSLVSFCVPTGTGADETPLCCTNADCGRDKLCAPVSVGGRYWTMACR